MMQDRSGAYVRQSYSFQTRPADLKVRAVRAEWMPMLWSSPTASPDALNCVHLFYLYNNQDEAGRYHLYLGNACPWCHRVLLAYVLRGFSPETLSITQLGSDPTKARRYELPCPSMPFGNACSSFSLFLRTEVIHKSSQEGVRFKDKLISFSA